MGLIFIIVKNHRRHLKEIITVCRTEKDAKWYVASAKTKLAIEEWVVGPLTVKRKK